MRALCLAAPLLLAACSSGGTDQSADVQQTAQTESGQTESLPAAPTPPSSSVTAQTPAATASANGNADQSDMRPAELIPEAEKGEKGARNVLLYWAKALEQKQFAKAYAQFGDSGPQNGMSKQQYADSFAKYESISVAMPSGQIEGAAGSLYYAAPTTITGTLKSGGLYKLQGPVVLRRVDDVPGATPEQLHWHIYSTDLKRVD